MGEEKRLAYVGVTRAMDRLYLLSVQVRGKGREGAREARQGVEGQGPRHGGAGGTGQGTSLLISPPISPRRS